MSAPEWCELELGAFDRDAAGQLALDIPARELAAVMRPDDDAGTAPLCLEW